LSFQPIDDFLNIKTYTIHNGAKVERSGALTVVTPDQQWAYAVSFPLRKGADLKHRTIIRVCGWVNAGRIGIGLLTADGTKFLDEVFRTPNDGLTCFDLSTDHLADCATLVVRNAAKNATSKITIESIRAYRRLREITRKPVTVRWVESRQLELPDSNETANAAATRERLVELAPQNGRNDGERPAISLILTIKNGMPHLAEALESVRQQDCRNFELIVQDCVSSDGSLECVGKLADVRVDVRSEPDSGIGDAWQRAFQRCRGDIVGSIDSDNLLKPDALSTVWAIFEQHPCAAAVYGSVEGMSEDGTVNAHFCPGPFDLLHVISCQLVPPWSTAFFSRRVCGGDLTFDASLRVCVDFDVWLRIGHLPILQTDKVLGATRLSNKSMTCRIETYDAFCEAKARALKNYVERLSLDAFKVPLLRYGLEGIYCWAAESALRLGASQVEVEKYLDLAFQAQPASVRAKSIRAAF
jgi:glycosyltransferase involved in cell wall biosynthesis